jgi:hypothetical protein
MSHRPRSDIRGVERHLQPGQQICERCGEGCYEEGDVGLAEPSCACQIGGGVNLPGVEVALHFFKLAIQRGLERL